MYRQARACYWEKSTFMQNEKTKDGALARLPLLHVPDLRRIKSLSLYLELDNDHNVGDQIWYRDGIWYVQDVDSRPDLYLIVPAKGSRTAAVEALLTREKRIREMKFMPEGSRERWTIARVTNADLTKVAEVASARALGLWELEVAMRYFMPWS